MSLRINSSGREREVARPPDCRLCFADVRELVAANDDSVISPCRCDGGQKWVHRRCLTRWIELAEWRGRCGSRCELCGFFYVRERRLKPLKEWRIMLDYGESCLMVALLVLFSIFLAVFVAVPFLLSLCPRPWNTFIWIVYWCSIWGRLYIALWLFPNAGLEFIGLFAFLSLKILFGLVEDVIVDAQLED